MDRTALSFEEYSAERLRQDSEQITLDWVERLSRQLHLDRRRVLPHQTLLDDIPVVLGRAAEFLLTPDTERIRGEQFVVEEMRNIASLRRRQGYEVREIIREFDELAQLLDGAALCWVDDYPGSPDPRSVGRVFGRLNRVPLLMGEITVAVVEEERNDLLRRLAAVEEEERTRLSRELHDQVGQLLTALLLGLKSLKRGDGAGDQSAQIRELERLADRIARETQQLALDLRPPALDNLGLRLALENLAREWSQRTGVEADFQAVGVDADRFSPEVESAVYRICQEALNNVLKHAGAGHASVILERRGRDLGLIVEDDGSGFDVEHTLALPEKARRLGVRGMRERVSRLGGSLEIESSEGSGTTVFVRFPDAAPAG
jgi:signal transduction histidine kinase